MKTEAQKKADKAYRDKNKQLSITIKPEIMDMIDKAAARTGKSKAQYIVDLIKNDNTAQKQDEEV